MTLNKKRFLLQVPNSKPAPFVCNEIRRENFRSGEEGIVFTYSNDQKIVKNFDIFKNKDGSTLQSQIDVLKRDLDIIDPANTINIKQMMAGVVLKIQTVTKYDLTFTPEGYVQSVVKTH